MSQIGHGLGGGVQERAPRWLPATALAVALVPFGLHTWFALQGFFAHDDWVYLNGAVTQPFDFGLLFQNYNGHVAPGAFALVELVTAVAPLNFAVAMLPLLVLQALTSFVLWRLLVRLFGPRWAILVPFAVFTCSPVIHTSTLWWAYALQLLPMLLALVLALDAHVRHVHTGSPRSMFAALAWTAAGMLFYEKAALFGFLLFGFAVLLAPHPGLRDGLRWSLQRFRRTWYAHGALLAGYAVLYLTRAADPVRSSDVEVASVPELAGRMVLDSLIVPSLGLPVDGVPREGVAQLVPPSELLRVLALVLAAGVVIVGCAVGRRRAVLAWTLLAGYLAADVALVTLTRLPLIGPVIGSDLRYVADAVPVMVLCAAFAYLTPLRPETAPVEVQPAADLRLNPRVHRVLAGVTAVAMAGATVSAVRAAPSMQFPTARAYLAAASAAIAAKPGMVFYDAPVPDEMMIGWFEQNRLASRVLATLPDAPRFDVPSERMYLLDERGRPEEIVNVGLAVTGRPGPVRKCGYPVGEQTIQIPLDRTVNGRQLLRIGYYTGAAGPAEITAGETTVDVELAEGPHNLHVVVDGSFDAITVKRSTPVDAVCVDRVEVGLPAT